VLELLVELSALLLVMVPEVTAETPSSLQVLAQLAVEVWKSEAVRLRLIPRWVDPSR
jgi:hypothetical protein